MSGLRVELGERSYPIHIEEMARLGQRMNELWTPHRCVLVSNPVVAALHRDVAKGALESAGWEVDLLTVPDGEANKTLDTWRALVEELLTLGLDRDAVIIALGGGVTGDIVGFAAASTMRGLPFVQVPTTLLAMVDSSVGGKTGVNTAAGKNLVGAFYQPRLVHAAVNALDTLSPEEYRCGLGEVVKHAVIGEPEFFDWLEEHAGAVLDRETWAVQHLVRTCCAVKAGIVAQDERESGVRAVLNLGHTIGHALERVLGYGVLRHGEAVGVGMLAESWIAVERGEAGEDLPARIDALLARLGLPRHADVDAEALVTAAGMDKKRRRGKLRVAYPVKIGSVRLDVVSRVELAQAAATVRGR